MSRVDLSCWSVDICCAGASLLLFWGLRAATAMIAGLLCTRVPGVGGFFAAGGFADVTGGESEAGPAALLLTGSAAPPHSSASNAGNASARIRQKNCHACDTWQARPQHIVYGGSQRGALERLISQTGKAFLEGPPRAQDESDKGRLAHSHMGG